MGVSPHRGRTLAVAAALALALLVSPACSDETGQVAACQTATIRLGVSAERVRPDVSAASGQIAVRPGELMFVAGARFFDGCVRRGSTGTPRPGIRLFVVQGGQRVSVALVNPTGADGEFSTRFGAPTTLSAGTAQVVAVDDATDTSDAVATMTFTVTGA